MKKLLLTIISILVTSNLYAQTTVINPNFVEFIASADHNTMVGSPAFALVNHYDLNTIIGNASGALAWTEGLGKPTPNAQNLISITVPRFATLPKGTYVVTVDAVPDTRVSVPKGTSLPSDPFIVTGPIAAPGKPATVQK